MLIKNGLVVSEKLTAQADVRIEHGKITQVGHSLKPHLAEEVLDATGLHLLPGMVDAHVHFRDFQDVATEDWFSGSSSALAGGVTSVIEMPNSSLATVTPEALSAKRLVASKKSYCDYAFHFGATDDNVDVAVRAQKETDVAGLKVYLGQSTGKILVSEFASMMGHFSNAKKPLAVHAEDAACLAHFQSAFEPASENHGKLRDPLCAELAVSRALALAERTGAALHVCHVTTPQEVRLIAEAKKRGVNVSCEVSPHHLFLDESFAKTHGNYGKVNPPLRSKADVAALWTLLQKGAIDLIATDHAPHLKEAKELPYAQAPSGMPGLDTALPLLLHAVHEKRLSIEAVVRLYSAHPAKRFNLSGKGRIAKGYDADVVLVDLDGEHEVLNGNLFTKCGWSAFEGRRLKGRIEKVFLRGQLVVNEGSIVAGKPFGLPLRIH